MPPGSKMRRAVVRDKVDRFANVKQAQRLEDRIRLLIAPQATFEAHLSIGDFMPACVLPDHDAADLPHAMRYLLALFVPALKSKDPSAALKVLAAADAAGRTSVTVPRNRGWLRKLIMHELDAYLKTNALDELVNTCQRCIPGLSDSEHRASIARMRAQIAQLRPRLVTDRKRSRARAAARLTTTVEILDDHKRGMRAATQSFRNLDPKRF